MRSVHGSSVETEAEPTPETAPGGDPAVGTVRSEIEAGPTPSHRRLWILAGVLAILVTAAAIGLLIGRDEEAGDGGAQRDVVPVRAARVELGNLSVYAEYPGELVGEVSDLAPKVSGILREVRVRIGDRVERGDVVAVIDDTDLRRQLEEARGQLGVTEAQERKARAELEVVRSELRRSEDLYRQNVVSEQDYELVVSRAATAEAQVGAAQAQIEQAQARVELLRQQLADTRVVAPFDGTVAARYLDPGALVQPGSPIVRLVERGRLLVQFRVPERDLGVVREEVELSVRTEATAGSYVGHVQRIAGEVSRTDRTALVEGSLDRPVEILRPGMYAQVRVRVRDLEGVTIVPGVSVLERVSSSGEVRTGVFVVDEAGAAAWHAVEVLGRSAERVAIESDLAAGDAVLTLGHEELRDGATVRVVQWQGRREEPEADADGPEGAES